MTASAVLTWSNIALSFRSCLETPKWAPENGCRVVRQSAGASREGLSAGAKEELQVALSPHESDNGQNRFECDNRGEN